MPRTSVLEGTKTIPGTQNDDKYYSLWGQAQQIGVFLPAGLQEAAGVSQGPPPTTQLICLYAGNLMIQLPTHHRAPPVALHSEVRTKEQICDSEEQGLGQWPGIFIIFISLK